jgi:hypothetical protein
VPAETATLQTPPDAALMSLVYGEHIVDTGGVRFIGSIQWSGARPAAAT